MKWESRVVEIDMFFKIMVSLEDEGWRIVTANDTMVFLQRPTFSKEYSYDTVQDGYIVYDPDNKKIDPWDLMELLNN